LDDISCEYPLERNCISHDRAFRIWLGQFTGVVCGVQVMGALRKGDKSDGNVTLVVERRLERQDANASEEKTARFDY
jgi:hypothetical protein